MVTVLAFRGRSRYIPLPGLGPPPGTSACPSATRERRLHRPRFGALPRPFRPAVTLGHSAWKARHSFS
jgi:hypothetical protein